jgi:uncharacterized protein YkwD
MLRKNNRSLLKPLTLILCAALCCAVLPLSAGPQKKKSKQKNAKVAPGMEEAILTLVNNYRKHRGKPPLAMDGEISKAAYKHSLNMSRGVIPFGHADFDERIGELIKTLGGTAGAENVAFSPKGPQSVVHNWLNSDGHRQNIEGDYNYTGIGIAPAKNGYYYFTMIYIKKK